MENSKIPAFPILETETRYATSLGLTKREYFAAMAMQRVNPPTIFVGQKETEESFNAWSNLVINMADELLKALEK